VRRALVAGVAVAALALPVLALAQIVPQKGIGGINLGMTEAMVRAKIGDPDKRKRGTNDFGPYTILTYSSPAIVVTFQGNAGATAVQTSSHLQRTASGVGPGVTEAKLKAKLTGEKCRTESGTFRHCWLGSFLPGKRVTDFRIKNGRVTSVTVGIVID
jgi:hypothetical protein